MFVNDGMTEIRNFINIIKINSTFMKTVQVSEYFLKNFLFGKFTKEGIFYTT